MTYVGRRASTEPNIQFVVECRVCGRWMTVSRAGSKVGAHYSVPSSKPGQPAALCVGSGQPGLLLFPEMKPAQASTAARKLARRWM